MNKLVAVSSKKSKSSFFYRVLVIFVPLIIISITASIALFKLYVNSHKAQIQVRESTQIKVSTRAVTHSLKSLYRDLTYLANNHDITLGVQNIDGHSLQHLSLNWLEFVKANKSYDQIRFLDNDGYEKVRVNYDNNKPYIVPREQLQNKSNRYYFTNSIMLNKNEFFISPFDLNIENSEIEKPLKPMIRIAMPVFSAEGTKLGIVIINFLGNELFNYLEKILGNNSKTIWMLNSDGYWLKGPSPEDEWGFMYKPTKNNIDNKYPDAWNEMKNKSSGQFYNEDGLWSYDSIYTKKVNTSINNVSIEKDQSEQHWKLVLLSPQTEFKTYSKNILSTLLIGTCILLVAFCIGAIRLVLAWTAQEKSQNMLHQLNESLEDLVSQRTQKLHEAVQHAEKIAKTDVLTGLNNRRAFFEQANKLDSLAKRYGHKYTVIMLDLDHFKLVNDNYGHAMGDKVIVELAQTVNHVIRSSDIAGRIGGEEFAIVLPETECIKAKDLAERLRGKIEKIHLINNEDTITFTASFGVTEVSLSDASFDETLSRADMALYKAKEQGRNCIMVM